MSVWNVTCSLLARHLGEGARLDHVLEDVPDQMPPVDRRRTRHLVYGVVRHLGLLDACLACHLRSRPRPLLHAALLTGSFELLENPAQAPAIIHHAVDRTREIASASEARVVNAVLRKVVGTLAAEVAADPRDAVGLARRFSHPEWLVERWLSAFGAEATRQLLEWDQRPAPVHARVVGIREATGGAQEAGVFAETVSGDRRSLPAFFQATPWPGFFLLERADWAEVERLLSAGRIYLQDPATALAPELLAAASGEAILDVCAAPGGKTLQLAEAVGASGRVVAVDLPGLRLERLKDNLCRHAVLPVHVVGSDGLELTPAVLAAESQPQNYDGVLLDVPCSNTGVLRHRVDAKWRLSPADLDELPRLQLALLRRVAALVRLGGRVVYSTCSLETPENEAVVQAFLGSKEGEDFSLVEGRLSRPWIDGRDGASAFLLRRALP